MADTLRTMGAALRFQLWVSRRKPGDLQALVTVPLFAAIFLAIATDAGRTDLYPHAVLAPALIAVVGMSLLVAGEIIDEDRWFGTLEGIVASPTPLATVLVGRVLGVVALSFFAFAEAWLVAWIGFGVLVPLPHPGLFIAGLAATAVGMAGTSLFAAALFVLARSARTFQNSLSYPLYVLGGVMVPVALLPGWLEPLARAVYLSWSADLLRDALTTAPVEQAGARLAVIVALGLVAAAAGRLLLGRILDRVRRSGTIAHA